MRFPIRPVDHESSAVPNEVTRPALKLHHALTEARRGEQREDEGEAHQSRFAAFLSRTRQSFTSEHSYTECISHSLTCTPSRVLPVTIPERNVIMQSFWQRTL